MELRVFPFILSEEDAEKTLDFKNVIVFGAGTIGKTVIYLLKTKNISVKACFDNDHEKNGEQIFENLSCELPKLINCDIPVLIAVESLAAKKEICHQCNALGYAHIYHVDFSRFEQYISELSDEEYLKVQYFVRIGQELNLENPKTFNEKLQWLKLYDRNPEYTKMVDKYEVKKYVAALIGDQYIIPTLGVWDQFEEINFDKLPQQFVLKCTHDSGSISIIADKNNMDYQALKEKFVNALQRNYYTLGKEWVYKDVKPRIIAEQYMIDEFQGGGLFDYKVHCFNGVPTYIQMIGNRNLQTHSGFQLVFDFDWNEQNWSFGDYPKYAVKPLKPAVLDDLYSLSKLICKNHQYIRLDFYIVKNRIFFGEMTFIPASGYYIYNEDWKPETDLMMGNQIKGSWKQ